MKKVSIERVIELIDAIDNINQLPFDEIEWQLNGKSIDRNPDIFDHWKFIGLSNIDFIRSEYYRNQNMENVNA